MTVPGVRGFSQHLCRFSGAFAFLSGALWRALLPFSRQREAGVLRIEGKLLHLLPGGLGNAGRGRGERGVGRTPQVRMKKNSGPHFSEETVNMMSLGAMSASRELLWPARAESSCDCLYGHLAMLHLGPFRKG